MLMYCVLPDDMFDSVLQIVSSTVTDWRKSSERTFMRTLNSSLWTSSRKEIFMGSKNIGNLLFCLLSEHEFTFFLSKMNDYVDWSLRTLTWILVYKYIYVVSTNYLSYYCPSCSVKVRSLGFV